MQIFQQIIHSRIFCDRIFYNRILYSSRSFHRISYHEIQYWILELSKCNHKSNNMIFFYNISDHCPIENSWEHPQCEDVKRVVDDFATTRNLSLDLIQQIWDLFSKQERCIQSLSCSLLLEQSFTTTSTNILVSMKGGGRSNQFGDVETSAFNQRIHWRHVTRWWSIQIKSRHWNEVNHLVTAYSP